MRIVARLKRLAAMPPRAALLRLGQEAGALAGLCRDWVLPADPVPAPPRVTPVALPLPRAELAAHRDRVLGLAERACEHTFDLLGSGWTRVAHGVAARGVAGHRYALGRPVAVDRAGDWLRGRLPPACVPPGRRLWRLVDAGYVPIDWQLDFKSGYRWSERTWYRYVPVAPAPGADIKVPWELARLQHLPMLAFAAAVAGTGEPSSDGRRFVAEVRNQVLDFLATNPPRFGVNWRCTMDVAIRAANCLIAHDLLKAAGIELDAAFEEAFAAAMVEHGRHIAANLEHEPGFRSNHYLADVAGLLVVAAHLPRSTETDAWLGLGVQELLSETAHQFGSDGGHFEASTSYHRLATEMALYAGLVCRGLGPEHRRGLVEYDPAAISGRPRLRSPREQGFDPTSVDLLPTWFWERLEKAAELTLHATRPSGAVVQIGDNDSGRFLKLWPALRGCTVSDAVGRHANLEGYAERPPEAEYLDEDVLDHGHLLRVAAAVFGRDDLADGAPDPETALVSGWLGGRTVASYLAPGESPAACRTQRGTSAQLEAAAADLVARLGSPVITRFEAAPGPALTDGLVLAAYERFGLYLYRSGRLFLAFRCGPIGQDGRGGHAHNDQLAVELTIDGADLVRDPGTFLYTPAPATRNEYRATAAHFTPQRAGHEQNDFGPGQDDLFVLQSDRARAQCLCVTPNGILGVHHGFGDPVYRLVRISAHAVEVADFGRVAAAGVLPPFSPGYGKQQRGSGCFSC